MIPTRAVFDKVIPLVLQAEGQDKTDGSNDYGGITRYGISHKAHPNINLDSITLEQAMQFLELNYWLPYRLNEISYQVIANQIFLLVMNMNPLNAGRIVQLAINDLGKGIVMVRCDGIIGSKTLSAINDMLDFECLSNRIRARACEYYLHEVDRDIAQLPNLRSWIRRALL